MLTIICGVSILGQVSAGETILDEAVTKIERATTLSMTVVETTEEFPRPRRTECAFRKGVYLRIDNGRAIQIANPKAAWMLSVKEKTYAPLPILPMGSTAIQAMNWLDVTFGNLPILNVPTKTVWHGKKALRLDLDGRKKMTKETKLFVFLQPDTHLPLGISANLGSITQVVIFEKLKLDPKLDDSLFTFVPSAGWKKRKV